MIKTFTEENQEYRDYIAANDDAQFYRYVTKIVVFTGDDVPPDDLDERYCALGIDRLREELEYRGHDGVRIRVWLEKYV